MTRILTIGLAVAVSVTAAAAAPRQTAPAPAQAPVASPSPAPVAGAPNTSVPTGRDTAPGPQGYTYRAEGRRDPFVTLVKRGPDASLTTAFARSAGLAGLGTGEVSLRGTILSQGMYVGMLLGSDDRTYIVRAGDKLADGTIRSISRDELVILQQVRDPLAVQKQREVRKPLRQMDGLN
jgi:Tfp pilus assembly protein PilP